MTVPEFSVPPTRARWLRQRAHVRRRLVARLGDLPRRPAMPAAATVVSREDRGDHVVERLALDNAAGAVVPGVVVRPAAAPPRGGWPVVLYHHWHGDQYTRGKIELFQREHTPEEPGPALARRGYLVIAIDAYGFGERQGQGPGGPAEGGRDEELSAAKLNLWLGRTLWGMMLRDDRMALDYVWSRPDVDRTRIGAMGMSMGATRTWWLMALDERVRAGVAVACLTRYQNLIAHQALAEHGIYYYVPGLLQDFDTEAIVSLIAPRPVLFLTGDRDGGSPPDGVRTIASTVRRVYDLYGQRAHFRSRLYRGVGHEYLPAMWTETMRWMDRHVGKATTGREGRSLRRSVV